MKKQLLKASNAVLTAFLSFFCVLSCEEPSDLYGPPYDNMGSGAYGCPASEYSEDIEITGTVQNEAQQPIENVQVFSSYKNDTTYTDASGNFAFRYGRGLNPAIIRLNFNDIDGATNGSYQNDTAHVHITYTGGDGGLNSGVGHGSVTKTLREKTE